MGDGLHLALEGSDPIHPVLLFLLFLLLIGLAYWFFSLRPYSRGRAANLLSPWHVRRPAVPGVLERYSTWEWVKESHLTSFGAWVYQEVEHQHLSLAELARRADIELDVLISLLYADRHHDADLASIRTIARVLGAPEDQIVRFGRVETSVDVESSG